MEEQARAHSPARRFFQVTSIETLRRLGEMILLCLAVSLLKLLCEQLGIQGDSDLYPASQLLFFVVFKLCMSWLCGKSSRRVRYVGRYYAANCIAYLIFFMLSGAVMYYFGISIYMLPFRVTCTLVLKQVVSLSNLLYANLLFHGITLIVILLSPWDGFVGLYYRLKRLFRKKR